MAKLFNVIVSESVGGYVSSVTFPFESEEKARMAVSIIKDKFNEDIKSIKSFWDKRYTCKFDLSISILVNRDDEFQAANDSGEFGFNIKLEEVGHTYDDDMENIIPDLANVIGYKTKSYHIV